jgi:ATP-dependent Lon protease
MFLKSLESTLLHLNAFNEVDEHEGDEKLFQLKLIEKSHKKLQEKVLSAISHIDLENKAENYITQPLRTFKMDNPFEDLIELKHELNTNNDSFLKLQVYFENEEYFLNEMTKYIDRNIEDILDIKTQVDEVKRVLLNIQIKANIPERSTKEIELKLNRLVMSSSDIKKGLESIKEKTHDSKMKRALAWGEFKGKHCQSFIS